jgi:CBS domain-containing protein
MQSKVEIVRTNDTIQTAAQRMRDHDIGFLPVVNAQDLVVGTVTDRDLVIRGLAEGERLEAKIEGCMTREVISCAQEDEVEKAEELMSLYQKSRIVVLDERGRLAGVISVADLARSRDKRETGAMLREVKAETPTTG